MTLSIKDVGYAFSIRLGLMFSLSLWKKSKFEKLNSKIRKFEKINEDPTLKLEALLQPFLRKLKQNTF